MTDKDLISALRSMSVETRSLVCLGCGHEHGCSTHGCAILREAAERIDVLRHIPYKHPGSAKKTDDNPPLTLGELCGMGGEPVYMVYDDDEDGFQLSSDAADYIFEVTNCGAVAYRHKPEED